MQASTQPSTSEPSARLYFLDWARIAAFVLLVLFHVGMYYVTWDWHVKSPHASAALEPWMRLLEPWRMGLLFLVSGAATSIMLARSGASTGWLRRRSNRLLLPLLIGIVIVVPPQSYFQVVEKFNYDGSLLDFLKLYFTAYGGFCSDGDCLKLPTWNHLWFLPYVWFYTLALWTLQRWRADALDRLTAGASRALAGVGLLLAPIACLALARILLLTRFGSTHALIDDWHNHAAYAMLFVLGVALARQPALFERMAVQRWRALLVALLCWGLLNLYFGHYGEHLAPPLWLRHGQRIVHACLQWTAIVAVLGFARRHLNRDHRWRSPLNEAVFPLYILHQTIIVLGAVALRPLQLPPAIEAMLLIVLTFGLALLGWQLLRRVGPLRPWFGMAAQVRKRNPSPPTRGSSQAG